MSEGVSDFKVLDSKLLGNDTVVFRLEDGAMLKVKVFLGMAGVAINPDGSLKLDPNGGPIYNFNLNPHVTIIQPNRTYKAPLNLPTPTAQPPKGQHT